MNADLYLARILSRETANYELGAPARSAILILRPLLVRWANRYLAEITPSGSFAKGTAIKSGTDIDIFVSLRSDTPETLKEIYNKLFTELKDANYEPSRQNVSINIRVNGYSVDVVPGKLQHLLTRDHSLYQNRRDTWIKTNIAKHIATVKSGGRLAETRLLKIWRNQKRLDFPSFYLELTIIEALRGIGGSLSDRIREILLYLRDKFSDARVVDPANTNNIISDDLSLADRRRIADAAARALNGNWEDFVS